MADIDKVLPERRVTVRRNLRGRRLASGGLRSTVLSDARRDSVFRDDVAYDLPVELLHARPEVRRAFGFHH